MKFLSQIDGANKLKQDPLNRFVTDTDKLLWDTVVDKASSVHKHPIDEITNFPTKIYQFSSLGLTWGDLKGLEEQETVPEVQGIIRDLEDKIDQLEELVMSLQSSQETAADIVTDSVTGEVFRWSLSLKNGEPNFNFKLLER